MIIRSWQKKFAIMSIPSLLVFKSGKLVKSAVGLHDKEALAALVKISRCLIS